MQGVTLIIALTSFALTHGFATYLYLKEYWSIICTDCYV